MDFFKQAEQGITKTNKIFAIISAMLIFPMIGIVVVEVIIRFLFTIHLNLYFDVAWVCFMAFSFLGGAYALIKGTHIKVDFFYNRLENRGKIIINSIGYPLLFFLPMGALVFSTFELFLDSWRLGESGFWTPLEYPMWPLRFAIFLGVSLMALQGFVELSKFIREVKSGEKS